MDGSNSIEGQEEAENRAEAEEGNEEDGGEEEKEDAQAPIDKCSSRQLPKGPVMGNKDKPRG